MPTVTVHVLPEFVEPSQLPGKSAVIIDVLRASTTMIHALANGAKCVIPCLHVEDAQRIASELPAGQRLLGGERGGRLIPGFDLGNSPLQYTPDVVQGKTVVFTTTNGTRALLRCSTAADVLVGAFVNRAAVARRLRNIGHDVHLVCAGTDGKMSAEDILLAGALAHDLLHSSKDWSAADIATRTALEFYEQQTADPAKFREAFLGSLGALNLIELGMLEDIERSMQPDLFAIVPRWNPATGQLTAS